MTSRDCGSLDNSVSDVSGNEELNTGTTTATNMPIYGVYAYGFYIYVCKSKKCKL